MREILARASRPAASPEVGQFAARLPEKPVRPAYMATPEDIAARQWTPQQMASELGISEQSAAKRQSRFTTAAQHIKAFATDTTGSVQLTEKARMIEIAKREHQLAKQQAEGLPPKERQVALKDAARVFQESVEAATKRKVADKPSRFNWESIAENTKGIKWKSLSQDEQAKFKQWYSNHRVAEARKLERAENPKPRGGPSKIRLVPGVGKVKAKPGQWREERGIVGKVKDFLSDETGTVRFAKPVLETPKGLHPSEHKAYIEERKAKYLKEATETTKALETTLSAVTDAPTIYKSFDALQKSPVYEGTTKTYIDELNKYLFKGKTGSAENPKPPIMVQAYTKLSGNELFKPVPIEELYKAYAEQAKGIEGTEAAAKKYGRSFYVKSPEDFRDHLQRYGTTLDDLAKTPSKPYGPWIVDTESKTVYLAPRLPGEAGVRALADRLPTTKGLKLAAGLPREERMGPELTVGRQPREARHHREFQSLFTERYPTAARGMPGAPEAGARKPRAPYTRTYVKTEPGFGEKPKIYLKGEGEFSQYPKAYVEFSDKGNGVVSIDMFRKLNSHATITRADIEEVLGQIAELHPEATKVIADRTTGSGVADFGGITLGGRKLAPINLTKFRKPSEAHHREFAPSFSNRFPTATRMMPGAPEAGAKRPGKIITRGSIGPKQPKPRVLTEGPTLPSGAHEVKGPRGGKIGPRDPARALKGTWTPTGNPIKNAWHGVQSYLSPSTASEGARGAAQTMRAEIGEQKRHVAQQVQRLEGYRGAINALDPEAKRAIRDYLQGHEDVKPALALIKAPWMSFVKAINETRKAMEKQIADLPGYQEMEFEENHLAQYWQESMRDQKKMAARGHFIQKKYESYRAGEAAGLHAKFEDPIQIVFQEMRDMANFLSKEHSLDALEKDNYAKRLGSMEREPVGTQLLQHVGKRRIYAAEDVARAWNNQWGPGVFENKDMGRLYMDTVRAMNASTAFTLGLSTKHAFNIAYGAIELNLQSAVKAAAAGRPITAAKHLAGAPAAPYSLFRKGSGLHDVFTGAAAPKDERMARVASLLAQSNMNITEFEPIYRSSGHMSWVEAYKVGLLGKEFATDVKGAANLRKPITALGHTYNLVSKTMDSMMHPLFSYAIPRVKAGAFFMKMNDFMDSHPGATDWEKVQEAQRIADSIENVEGMMTQGNIMVAPLLKQSANLILQAPGWTFGALRAYGQGAADILKGTAKLATGKKVDALSESAAYTIAAALTTAGVCAFAQAIMGAGPPTSPLDLILPRTGGKNPDGTPERFAPFGNVKDLVGYYHDWKGELSNKIRGPWKAAYETLTNHDWAKHVIADPLDPWQKRVKDVVGNIIKNIGEPISVQQLGTATPGSALPNAARAAGFTPAGQWAANPQRTQAFERRNEMKEHRQRLRFERRQENRKVPVTKPLTFARPGVEQTPRQPLRFEYRQ